MTLGEAKECSTCKATHPVTMFRKDPRFKSGYGSQCRNCRLASRRVWIIKEGVREHLKQYKRNRYRENINGERDKALKLAREHRARSPELERERNLKKYGLSTMDYDRIYNSQHGKCAICGESVSGRTYLCVDHDHSTLSVRGLLCVKCNTGLGTFNDNPALLEAAAGYLRLWKQH